MEQGFSFTFIFECKSSQAVFDLLGLPLLMLVLVQLVGAGQKKATGVPAVVADSLN